jgi:CheY-like chemotaxis protein
MEGMNDRPLILLADDERPLATVFSLCLRRAGYNVKLAFDGKEALASFLESPKSFTMVVTDVQMPFVSGLELAEAASGHGCPVLLISASDLPSEAAWQGWAFLRKPFHHKHLLTVLRNTLESREGAASPAIRPRLLVVDDQPEIRKRLCALLDGDYEVVAALESGEDVLERSRELNPEAVLLDISMPGANGIHVTRALRRSMPQIPVLIVTQHNDPAYVDEAFRSGAAGYLLKRKAAKELKPAVQQVLSGRRYLSSDLQPKASAAHSTRGAQALRAMPGR